MKLLPVCAALIDLGLPVIARADPCEGRLPSRPGQTFSGVVRYVGDGDGLCVGQTDDPREWIEVRLADFDAPELNQTGGRTARDILIRAARGRSVDCTETRGRNGRVISHDRVIATCRLGGRRLGDLLRAQATPQGGNGLSAPIGEDGFASLRPERDTRGFPYSAARV